MIANDIVTSFFFFFAEFDWLFPSGIDIGCSCLLFYNNALLLQAAYIINGNCKNVMNMSQSDQEDLWTSVMNGTREFHLMHTK